MTCLDEIFRPICSDVQNQVKKALKGFITGGIVRSYLPQHWVFITELETVTFAVNSNGNASIISGESQSPDVTIEIDHDYLCTALKTKQSPSFNPRNFNVSFQTQKGKTAFNYLRKHLGL